MVRACSPHGQEDECLQGFGGQTKKERDYKKDLDIDGKILLQCVLEN